MSQLDYAELELFCRNHPAWRLLRSEHAPFAASFLHKVFVAPNARSLAQADLAEGLEDYLFDLRERLGAASLPRSAQEYLNDWAGDDKAWLRKFYPSGSDEPHFDLTPATEKALQWLCSLGERPFVGTESRILTLFELLRQIAEGTEADPAVRIAELHKRRDAIDAEIAMILDGRVPLLDDTAIKDRFQQFIQVARDLLSDFREVEQNFRRLDRQVREKIALWEGSKGALLEKIMGERDAIERLLRNFGLSLLISDEHYAGVAEWVDRTFLKGRLIYFRVKGGVRAGLPALQPDSLARKISIKPDSPFYAWMEREIAHRYSDFVCCTSQEQFRREANAVTRAGQIKTRGERHEKDDRYGLEDRSRYVLGWSNAAKIDALEAKARVLAGKIGSLGSRLAQLQKSRNALRDQLSLAAKLEEFTNFADLDWRPLAMDIDALQAEKQRLETASDLLRSLQEQLAAVGRELAEIQEKLEKQRDERARIDQRRSDAESLRKQIQGLLNATALAALSECQSDLESLRREALGEHPITIESCDNREQETRQFLQSRIDAEEKKIQRIRENIVDAMRKYHSEFPLEAREADVSVEAANEYRAMLDKLVSDDLPRFESRFKELLNVNTINEVVNFQGQLARERETIKERIERINASLRQIDYNPNRYILLEAQLTQDADVRDFQGELRTCTENALTGSDDDQYAEAKFLQVKRIIERFRGREGQSDLDRRWTDKVTDVRNWFVFAASERNRENDAEYEHYSDSGGKSGGQKEKLAYTVLAASLAYQFGLEWNEKKSRTFRLVVIDEAFGRGSDESAQYGLELFSKLNLQLLIVTPLQKIHIIEPFVSNVGFVHSENGQISKLRNLSIEEYRQEKKRMTA